VLIVALCSLVVISGCAKKETKIPVTTSSDEAREIFLEGRDLFERLQFQESLQYFEKAVEEDPDFAMGYLFLAQTVPSARGFFEHLDRAVALSEKASDGERWYILGVKSGAEAFPMKQREYYIKMVEAYPEDERALTLLGNNYFAQQEYEMAIEKYNLATEINPDFSQPYNQLGYAHRFLENYDQAEEAFQKYIELIPDDPNPYDSYAELLLKVGRFDESIAAYQKALMVNPNFVASHTGIATNLNLKGQHEEARKQIKKLYKMARNDGERRAAHFAMTVSYVDQGDFESAIAEQKKQYALAEKINDATAMAGDLVTIGNIHLETGDYDEALEMYTDAELVVRASDRSQEVKDNAKRGFLFNSARVDMKKGDFDAAKTKAGKYLEQVEAINNPFLIRLAHQLSGMIALEEKDYDKALEELRQADQQNPSNLYRMALAHQGKGNEREAKQLFKRAADFNAVNALPFAFCRAKALKMLESM
jgi:tetratricopeptide (TPR) repeat protein